MIPLVREGVSRTLVLGLAGALLVLAGGSSGDTREPLEWVLVAALFTPFGLWILLRMPVAPPAPWDTPVELRSRTARRECVWGAPVAVGTVAFLILGNAADMGFLLLVFALVSGARTASVAWFERKHGYRVVRLPSSETLRLVPRREDTADPRRNRVHAQPEAP